MKNCMVRLTPSQIDSKLNFIDNYCQSLNAATGSIFDANANVSSKNISTLHSELHKDLNIQINRQLVYNEIEKTFGKPLADEYLRQLESHEIYTHDETNVYPYTYCGQESIIVEFDGVIKTLSFDDLYHLSKASESNPEPGVFVKYPEEVIYILDTNGKTKITRLVKKERHRPLVRVKTQGGEDIIVTDNHPLIIDDDQNTIDAVNSQGNLQYKPGHKLSFRGKTELEYTPDWCDIYDNYVVNMIPNEKKSSIRRKIKLTEQFGYFVGFFIAEGHYYKVNGVVKGLVITQNDKDKLRELAKYLYETTGVSSVIYDNSKYSHSTKMYRLWIDNTIIAKLFREVFNISEYAQNKKLPVNLYEYNIDFAKGIVAGILDGDGTIHASGSIQLNTCSRTMISQLMTLLSFLGFGPSLSFEDPKPSPSKMIQQQRPLWKLSTYILPSSVSLIGDKIKRAKYIDKNIKRKDRGWVSIRDVKEMTNEYFLEDNKYIYDITTESHTFVLNNIWVHNCVSISMYPFLLNGMRALGGESLAPKHLDSYCGSFINLVFAISSQFAGAVATVEFLMHFDYFARKDYGSDYLRIAKKKIDASLQHVVYSLNQPAAARGFQSVFWNISLFDQYFFNSIFDGFVYPGTDDRPDYSSLKKLQKYFLKWFNKERERSLLTFPVITCALLNGQQAPKDRSFANMISKELSEGNSFFIYQSNSVDSLASCCRVRNAFQETPEFSYTLGAGGVATGSINVITININRLIQDNRNIREEIQKIHKYQYAYRQIIKRFIEDKMIPAYDAGYIFLDKQYSTIGIMGFVEAAESQGIEPSNNPEYHNFLGNLLRQIYDENRMGKKKYNISFNTEMVPGESLGVKFAKWDKIDNYKTLRDCYNSYFYPVEAPNIDIYDKFILHGRETIEYLDGGSALHLNLDCSLSQSGYYNLLKLAVKTGCNYWTVNVKSSVCEDCGYISKKTEEKCPKCKSSNITYATRIIGYLKKVSSFSYDRQLEHTNRLYHAVQSPTSY